MTYDWQIQPGDSVKVFYCDDDQRFYYGTVRNVPSQTGEAWIIEDDAGVVMYQQNYNRIIRLRRGS